MKLTALFMLICCLHISAKTLSQTVNFSGKNLAMEQALAAIEKQTGYSVFYDKEDLRDARRVTIATGDLPLEDFLTQLFKDQPLTYAIKNTSIFVTRKPRQAAMPYTDIQDQRVNGYVQDSTGKGLQGVTVRLLEGKKGTITDVDGKFSLVIAPGEHTLEFSLVGYKTVRRQLTIEGGIDVPLSTVIMYVNESRLDEIVIINKGYYTERQRYSTGNVSKIDSKTMEQQPVSNPIATLQGRVPGVYVQQVSGVPGGGFDILVRGRNSIRSDQGASDPLYIVDGITFSSSPLTSLSGPIQRNANPLNNLNLNDIESIQVLKDADATSIYGSRGANGVILITTKRGKAGPTKVELNVYSGFGKVARQLDLLNTQQYVMLRKEAFRNDNVEPTAQNARDLMVWDTTRYTDWQKELIGGTAHFLSAQASVSGGNERTQYLLSTGLFEESTVFPGDRKARRYATHFSLNHASANGRFTVRMQTSYTFNKTNLMDLDPTHQASTLPPNAPAMYDESGKISWAFGGWDNPAAEMERKYNAAIDNLITSVTLGYKVMRNLSLKLNGSYNNVAVNDYRSTPISSRNPNDNPQGMAYFGTNTVRSWILEPQAEYRKDFSNGSTLSILAGGTFQENLTNARVVEASGYTSDVLLENIMVATSLRAISNQNIQYRYQAVFGRINYNLKDRYIVNATFRRDGSSRFGPGHQFGNFGAVGAAWIFSSESFISEALPFLSFGKLRSSYGTAGSDQVPDYGYLDTYSPVSNLYDGNAGIIPSGLANPDFRWESNRKLEVAMDLAFLKDRLTFNGSWFLNRSSNQLIGYSLSLVTGQPSVQYNFPATVQNTGWEFEIGTKNIDRKDLTWATSANLTIPRNKLIRFDNIEASFYSSTLAVGHPLTIRKVFQSLGVDPQTGVYGFTDYNNDGNISAPEDNHILLNVGQRWYGGLHNSIRFKQFTLDVLFQFVKQTGTDILYQFGLPGSNLNQSAGILNRWQKPGDQTPVQMFTSSSSTLAGYAFTAITSGASQGIVDASFGRLKNMAISYELPARIQSRLHTSGLNVYLMGQNLLTFTGYNGRDPEFTTVSTLPPLRTITAGLRIGF